MMKKDCSRQTWTELTNERRLAFLELLSEPKTFEHIKPPPCTGNINLSLVFLIMQYERLFRHTTLAHDTQKSRLLAGIAVNKLLTFNRMEAGYKD